MTTSLEPFEPLYPAGQVIDPSVFVRMQNDLSRILGQFVNLEMLDGLRLQDVTITTGSTNLINHKLGRAYRGWVVTNVDTACTIHLDETSTAATTLYLPLVASATCEVDLWVF